MTCLNLSESYSISSCRLSERSTMPDRRIYVIASGMHSKMLFEGFRIFLGF